MATIEKFTSLSGRSMCVLRPQTYDHDMLIAFCVMKGADFEEESDEENGHHNDDEEAEEVPEQGGKSSSRHAYSQAQMVKKRAQRFNSTVHIKGDLCQEITSPVLYFTLLLKNGKANLKDMKTQCYELVAIEDVTIPSKFCVGAIRRFATNSEYFLTCKQDEDFLKLRRLVRSSFPPQLLKVKKCDHDITEPVEIPTTASPAVKWILNNIDKPVRYFTNLNIFGSGIMKKMTRDELLQMDGNSPQLICRLPFYGKIRNRRQFDQIASGFHIEHQQRIFLSTFAAELYHELIEKERIFKQYWIDEPTETEKRWSNEVVDRLIDEIPNIIELGLVASENNARFLKLKKYSIIEGKIKVHLQHLKFCALLPFDVDDDQNYKDTLIDYVMRKHAMDKIGVVTFVQRRIAFLFDIFPQTRILSVDEWFGTNAFSNVDYLFVDRAHAADLEKFYKFLCCAKLRHIRQIYFFGSKKGMSDGVGNPFKAMCASKAPKFKIFKSRAPKYPYRVRSDRIAGYMRLDEYIQKRLNGECMVGNGGELILVSSVAKLNDIIEKSEGKISEDSISVWHRKIQNEIVKELTCIVLDGMDRSQLMKCYNCSNDTKNSILFIGSETELTMVCEKRNRNLGKDHFSVKLMDIPNSVPNRGNGQLQDPSQSHQNHHHLQSNYPSANPPNEQIDDEIVVPGPQNRKRKLQIED